MSFSNTSVMLYNLSFICGLTYLTNTAKTCLKGNTGECSSNSGTAMFPWNRSQHGFRTAEHYIKLRQIISVSAICLLAEIPSFSLASVDDGWRKNLVPNSLGTFYSLDSSHKIDTV